MSFGIFDALDQIGHPVPRTVVPAQIVCPFHKEGREQNPSARVYPATESLHCFQCAQSWSPISLVADHLGITYGAARALIRAQYGELQQTPPQTERLDTQLADSIDSVRYLARAQRTEALAGLDQIIRHAGQGYPDYELGADLQTWRRTWFARLV